MYQHVMPKPYTPSTLFRTAPLHDPPSCCLFSHLEISQLVSSPLNFVRLVLESDVIFENEENPPISSIRNLFFTPRFQVEDSQQIDESSSGPNPLSEYSQFSESISRHSDRSFLRYFGDENVPLNLKTKLRFVYQQVLMFFIIHRTIRLCDMQICQFSIFERFHTHAYADLHANARSCVPTPRHTDADANAHAADTVAHAHANSQVDAHAHAHNART